MAELTEITTGTYREDRRVAILDVTIRLLSYIRYEQMTMEGIAQEANVSKPTLYAYFTDKQTLALAAVERHFRISAAELDRLSASLAPQETIAAFALWAIHHRFLDGDALPMGSVGHLQSVPPFRDAHQLIEEKIANILESASKKSGIDRSLDTHVAARFVLTSIRDFGLQKKEANRDRASDTATYLKLLKNALFPAAPLPPGQGWGRRLPVADVAAALVTAHLVVTNLLATAVVAVLAPGLLRLALIFVFLPSVRRARAEQKRRLRVALERLMHRHRPEAEAQVAHVVLILHAGGLSKARSGGCQHQPGEGEGGKGVLVHLRNSSSIR